MYGTTSNSSISFNPTSNKHTVIIHGKSIETTVTTKASVTNDWVSQITSLYANTPMVVVGLDIEWRPNFSKWSAPNKCATLQLCIHNKCLILQLFYMDYFPQSLKNFLNDDKFVFVGVKVEDDLTKLMGDYGLVCSKNADIRVLANRGNRVGLKDLAFEIGGLVMNKPKHVTLSNWEARMLNESQVEYACIDAYASFTVGHKLLIGN